MAKAKDNSAEDEILSADHEHISVFGARVHNLKNIDISIPKNKRE